MIVTGDRQLKWNAFQWINIFSKGQREGILIDTFVKWFECLKSPCLDLYVFIFSLISHTFGMMRLEVHSKLHFERFKVVRVCVCEYNWEHRMIIVSEDTDTQPKPRIRKWSEKKNIYKKIYKMQNLFKMVHWSAFCTLFDHFLHGNMKWIAEGSKRKNNTELNWFDQWERHAYIAYHHQWVHAHEMRIMNVFHFVRMMNILLVIWCASAFQFSNFKLWEFKNKKKNKKKKRKIKARTAALVSIQIY